MTAPEQKESATVLPAGSTQRLLRQDTRAMDAIRVSVTAELFFTAGEYFRT
jgi:hypothetical protein